MKKINFCAGPGIMPRSVLEKAAQAVLDFNGMGLSLLEISHRSRAFQDVMDETCALVKELYELNAEYEVLFLGGGASMQFCMVPYNLLPNQGKAAYVKTGVWADKAAQEAQLFGEVDIVGSSEDKKYSYIPQYTVSEKHTYLHITTNNTIYGTQMQQLPANLPCPIVADMSSDIFSRRIDAQQFALIYAGAQKNMGPAGATMVIVRKDILGKSGRKIPTMLNYQTHIDNGSMFNTPPVFAIYCCYLTLQWIKERGLAQIEVDNRAKAACLYSEIDRNSLFYGTVETAARSLMNVTFKTQTPEQEKLFQQMANDAGCVALEGHRSVGGFRASLYNALDLNSVQVLTQVMREFEAKYA
jgi:phosphoserine aminotransferase